MAKSPDLRKRVAGKSLTDWCWLDNAMRVRGPPYGIVTSKDFATSRFIEMGTSAKRLCEKGGFVCGAKEKNEVGCQCRMHRSPFFPMHCS